MTARAKTRTGRSRVAALLSHVRLRLRPTTPNGVIQMNQAELLNELAENTHTLFSESFVEQINEAFIVSLKARVYRADGARNPKGLTTHDGAPEAKGLAAFELAPALCDALGVKYESKLGRGFQVRACVDALRTAGYGQ